MLDEKLLVFVLGAPGAGKGTQCDLIVKQYGWTHISAGDLLRAEVEKGTEVGLEAAEHLRQGTMVPASMIIGLLGEALSDARHTKVLIDGFPRVLDQLKEFEQQVRPCDKALFYNVPEEAARERLIKRGETSGRVDDNEETIRTRFRVFKEESMPVVVELETEGRVAEIDASQPPEQVFAATQLVIEQLQQQLEGKAAAAAAKQTAAKAAAAEAEAEEAGAAASPVAVSPVAAAADAGSTAASPAPASPVAAAAAAAAAAEGSSTPASPRPGIVLDAAASPVAAAAAASPAAASPGVASSPVAAAAAAGAAAVAAGTAAAALASSSPALSATSSPVKAAAAAAAASPAAAETVASPAAAAAAALSSAGSLPHALSIDHADAVLAAAVASPRDSMDGGVAPQAVTSPVAAAAAASAATPTAATLASLQVDLSGIRTPIVICGPSGVGKGTLIGKLMEQYADRFGFSVSHTTRDPRPGEVHGKHYYFTEKDAMAAQVAAGMFLEHAVVHSNMYGTSLAAVAQVSSTGKHCVLDIDVQGAAQVRKSALGAQCLFIFIAPPSQAELERRLRNRGTETEDKVLQRLANAESEIAKAQEPGLFHHVLVNAELEAAYQDLVKLIANKVPGLLPAAVAAAVDAAAAAAAAAPSSAVSSETTAATNGADTVPAAVAAVAASSNPGTPSAAAAAAPGTTPVGAAASPTNASAAAAAAAASHSPSAAAAGGAGAVAGVAGVAAMTATLGGQQPHAQQPLLQQQQQQPMAHPVLANGNTSGTATATAAPTAAAGGTATLLDFGFGASAGPAVAAKGMPVRQYMDATVIPVLREGLKALNAARPDDPLQFLADYLVSHKAAAA